jgi:predicted house-cleaning noncanonical NTP pyrophosphatase (MazG superfamily)
VRDKIPQIIKRDGKRAITDTLSEEEFEIYLERKLDEEVKEYHGSKSAEELADILEVVTTLAKIKGISFADLVDMQTKKAVRRGGFSKRILLVAVAEGE